MPSTHEKVSACLGPEGSAALVRKALTQLGGRWKLDVVFCLFGFDSLRFSDFERLLPGISQKMLAQRLRELEAEGLATRTVHSEKPLHVEYAATPAAARLRPVLGVLRDWSRETNATRMG